MRTVLENSVFGCQTVSYWDPKRAVCIRNVSDYSPFGVSLDGRTIEGDGYRYGYQGSEKDDETKGSGNSYTTLYRQLDPRVGRWLSIDPVLQPWQSPYCSMDGNPIFHNDIKGDSIPTRFFDENGNQTNNIPNVVQEMFMNEYGIQVGYNSKTNMMFKLNDVKSCGDVSESAKKEWESVLGNSCNSTTTLTFGYQLKIEDEGHNFSEVISTGVYNKESGNAYIDLADFDKDGNLKSLDIEYYSGFSGGNPQRALNMARFMEHEFLVHGEHGLSDKFFNFSDDTGPTVDFTNKFNKEMNIMERTEYDVLGGSIGLGEAKHWNAQHTKKEGGRIKAAYVLDMKSIKEVKNTVIDKKQ